MAEADVNPLTVLDKLEDQLTCPVCLDQYDNPKTLPCLHSFCLKCIQQLPLKLEGDKKLIDCPTCRAEVKLSSNGVEDLQSAFFINNLLEVKHVLKNVSSKQQVFCDNCEERQDASGYCKQCQTWLCEGCVTHHKKWKGFSSHELLDAKEIINTASQLNERTWVTSCSVHNKPLKVYCNTCQISVCHSCLVGHHRDHNYYLIKDVLPNSFEKINAILNPSHSKVSESFEDFEARLDQQQQPIKEEQGMSCSIHNDPLKVYCETCQALICRDCTISTHRDHDYHLVSDVFHKHSSEIKSVLVLLKKQVLATTDKIKALVQREHEVRDCGQTLKKEVDLYVQHLITILQESQKQKIHTINAIAEKKLKLLAQQKKEAEIALEQLQSCAEYVEQCLQHGSHQQVLMEKAKMVDRMNQMNEQTDPNEFEPQEKPDIMFTKFDSLLKKSKNIGFVSVGSRYSVRSDVIGSPMVGIKTTATFLLKGPAANAYSFPVDPLPILSCSVSSMEDGQTMICPCGTNNEGVIFTSFTPTVSGHHFLKVVCEDIAMSSAFFDVMPSPLTRKNPATYIGDLCKPMGVAIDEAGSIAVVENGEHRVLYIDKEEGKLSIASKGYDNGQLNNPRGIAFSSDGHILVTDDHSLQKFTSSGQHLMSFGSKKKGSGPQQFNTPMGIAVHPTTGEIYVADCYNHRIQVIDEAFSQSFVFGDHFKNPTDVCFSSSGVLYVCNSGNHSIEIYSPSSYDQIGEFGYRSSAATGYVSVCSGELNNPRFLMVDPHDNVYITETYLSFDMFCSFNDSRISCYRADGEFLRHIGRRGTGEGDLDNPSGIAMDKLGNLYISDTNNGRLVIM